MVRKLISSIVKQKLFVNAQDSSQNDAEALKCNLEASFSSSTMSTKKVMICIKLFTSLGT